MPRYIVHHDGYFFEWSTVVDAPVTPAMTREEFTKHYLHEYGQRSEDELSDRLERAIAKGTSSLDGYESAEELIEVNRAGPDETELTFDEVIAMVHEWRTKYPGYL